MSFLNLEPHLDPHYLWPCLSLPEDKLWILQWQLYNKLLYREQVLVTITPSSSPPFPRGALWASYQLWSLRGYVQGPKLLFWALLMARANFGRRKGNKREREDKEKEMKKLIGSQCALHTFRRERLEHFLHIQSGESRHHWCGEENGWLSRRLVLSRVNLRFKILTGYGSPPWPQFHHFIHTAQRSGVLSDPFQVHFHSFSLYGALSRACVTLVY